MAARKHKFQHITIYALLSAAIIIGLLCIWLYGGRLTPAKISAFQALPLPIALVNGSPIFMHDYVIRNALIQTMPDMGNQTQTAIFDELTEEEQVRQLAMDKGVTANQKQIDSEYQTRASQTDLQGKSNFEALLASYGLTPSIYKSQIIAPELAKINLQVWFNSQKNLNESAYTLADNLVQRIQNKEDMAALAQSYSADQNTKGVGGDMGFLDPAQTLPELREPLSSMQAGDIKILPSRYGLHIIRLEEKNGNNLHLRQIFLQENNYNNWLSTQTQNLKIKKLITF
jgi:hypothetical protein